MIRAPLRVSFFGGGTDSPESVAKIGPGLVLGTAIDLYVRYQGGSWKHPVCLGTGLGSSSAVHVIRQRIVHPDRDPLDTAWAAWEAERAEGSSVGWQDSTFASVGGFNLVEFRADRTEVHPVETSRLAELQTHLLVVYSGRRRTEDVAKQTLGRVGENVEALRLARRMADEGHRMLTGTVSMESFGSLLNGAWLAKRSTSPSVSSPEIDRMYQTAVEAGAWGGKLLGAGGGGFLLLVVAPERRERVERALGQPSLPFRIDAPGYASRSRTNKRG